MQLEDEMIGKRDAAYELAKYIADTKFDDIPSEALIIAKRFILDSLGVAIAGSTAPGIREIMKLIESWGGRPESTIFVSGKKVPAPEAAFVNGILIASRDFDDTHDIAVVHANATVLPSALAVAEQKGKVTGRELLTATVLGVDLACRLGLSLRFYKGWHYTSICGGFGAAAAASKILGLDERLTLESLGIVYSQIAGNVQCVRDGSLTKRMQAGFSAKAGVLSAYLSRVGITGTKNTFEGPYGFFRLYDAESITNLNEKRHRQSGRYGPHELLAELGSRFEVVNLGMKPYPSCRATHPAIEGALEICQAQGIIAEQIKCVRVFASERTLDRVGRPFEIDEGPQQGKAQFSIPYTVAVAIHRGDVSVEDFEEKNIRNGRILDLAKRVTVIADKRFSESVPVEIEIEIKSGDHYSKKICSMGGTPERPLSEREMTKKFRMCSAFSAKAFSEAKIDGIIQAVGDLEHIRDIGEITCLLS
jgi:2-methylcitrate dehydratase PrpD